MNSEMKTKAFPNRPGSPSLRATIPQGVVEALKIKAGDTLTWSLEVKEGRIVAIVEKEKG